ncbi:MAG: hypothetical protein ACD_34C00205G0001 [uncultured bacterium]|nr:MAG: hypothetical protein ACD_34C00205G0001 [uncultured bacterium]
MDANDQLDIRPANKVKNGATDPICHGFAEYLPT